MNKLSNIIFSYLYFILAAMWIVYWSYLLFSGKVYQDVTTIMSGIIVILIILIYGIIHTKVSKNTFETERREDVFLLWSFFNFLLITYSSFFFLNCLNTLGRCGEGGGWMTLSLLFFSIISGILTTILGISSIQKNK